MISTADTEKKKADWTKYRLGQIGTVFQVGERSEPLTLGAQWLFDSHYSQDELLSFVQAMVVLEIILGDKGISDTIGIQTLISNRFAYLVGDTHETRAALLKEFKKIYDVRSQIVHAGKHKLSYEERVLFLSLRWMCRRLIQKEMDLLKTALEKEKSAAG